MDKLYIYQGPVSSATLPGRGDIILSPGKAVTLPAESPYVATLLARGHLTLVPAAPERAKPRKSESKNQEANPNVR